MAPIGIAAYWSGRVTRAWFGLAQLGWDLRFAQILLLCGLLVNASSGAALERQDDIRRLRQEYRNAGWVPYRALIAGGNAIADFNFSADRRIINPLTGVADIATIMADGIVISGKSIGENLLPPQVTRLPDDRIESLQAIRVDLGPTDRQTASSWRTQLAGYPIEPYRQYAWLMAFRFDDGWDFDAVGEEGLLWQLKGRPKPDQYGNPVIAFSLYGDQLRCVISFPRSASSQHWGERVVWGKDGYDRPALPPYTVKRGQYNVLGIDFFADDRPENLGGKGYLRAWINGQLWFEYEGPTLHPDQAGPHQPLWGWYQWGGAPRRSRTVWWLLNEAFVFPR
ncbi:hypothetical protein AzCIB_1838 [Azoarcus sp. CIB]|uniref:heparin lyase I family protein n=1 Tax=Aromatoleum sp. (strain CIB) TaxID=198107 RepID=UPI00067C53DA|nr:heparin lyase I family protein [Azoarcus sp. CIB]AKU11733.1 hypothetical protein AzCIB_1838 [Azoarcus sp. CIB]